MSWPGKTFCGWLGDSCSVTLLISVTLWHRIKSPPSVWRPCPKSTFSAGYFKCAFQRKPDRWDAADDGDAAAARRVHNPPWETRGAQLETALRMGEQCSQQEKGNRVSGRQWELVDGWRWELLSRVMHWIKHTHKQRFKTRLKLLFIGHNIQ